MSRRSFHPVAPAVLVGMAVLVSLEAAALGSSAAFVLGSQPTAVLRSEVDRRAVATWMNCLSDAARAMQEFTTLTAGQMGIFRHLDHVHPPQAPLALMPAGPDQLVRPSTSMLATHMNLPPPAAML